MSSPPEPSPCSRHRLPGRRLPAALLGGAMVAACAGPAQPPDRVALPGSDAAGPPLSTYSIVARDAETGELGVAVQSHWFQVGALVPWAEAGVGAVATQSFVNISFGPRGLELMSEGVAAAEAVERLIKLDRERDVRQVAMVDARGGVGAWTGPRCIAEAGHRTGAGYSVQANLMERPTVWAAMGAAFEAARGPLAERLLAALEAAEAEGGDIRGRQSAALLVVRGTASDQPWTDRLVDLRVDDHPEPLAELRRLLERHHAYQEMNLGDEALAADDVEAALAHYARSAALAPEIVEIPFWQAVTLFSVGREAEALPIFRQVFASEPRWAELVQRLPASGLLPAAPDKLAAILAETAGGSSGGSPEGGRGDDRSDGALRITGRLTDEGVECPALRGDDGELYTLTGGLRGFGPGDRVEVVATPVQISFCMQGTTVKVREIRAAPDP